jgi:hypothetical protein
LKVLPKEHQDISALGIIAERADLFYNVHWHAMLDVFACEGPVVIFATEDGAIKSMAKNVREELLPARAKVKWLYPSGDFSTPCQLKWQKGTGAHAMPEWVELLQVRIRLSL